MTQKQEIEAVKQLGEAIGYGNMMSLATALWRKKLRDSGYPQSGAFIGTIYQLLNEEGKEIADIELPAYDRLIEKTLNDIGGGFQNSGVWETDGLSGFRG
jgi:hypothetical protein